MLAYPAIGDFTLYDLLSPDLLADPYPAFSRLRQESPIHEDPNGHGWILTRYDDIAAALSDRRLSAQRIVSVEERTRGVNPILAGLSRQMLFQDPPDHTRLRGLIAKAFTPQRIEALRPQVERMASRLFDRAEEEGGCIDFMQALAVPLPVAVIAEMLGLPEEDHRQLQIWSLSFGSLINGCSLTSEQMIEAQRGIYNLIRYLTKLIAEKRRRPTNDMLCDLIVAEQDGDRLDAEELIMNIILLFAAGHGTTTHLLGNAVLSLLRNPDQFQLLGRAPELAAPAVNELLRYDGPVQLTVRVAAESFLLEGRKICRGDRMTLVIASANHDDSRFADPDRLDIQRTGGRPLSFGYGMHTCVGAALGRMEAQVVLAEFARRYPATWLEENRPRRMSTIVFRGVESLQLTLA